MVIIIVTVVTQGAVVDPELKGNLTGLLFVNNGFFQAVGVISFGMQLPTAARLSTNTSSLCLPP